NALAHRLVETIQEPLLLLVAELLGEELEADGGAGHHLDRAVVHVACDPLALLLLRAHETRQQAPALLAQVLELPPRALAPADVALPDADRRRLPGLRLADHERVQLDVHLGAGLHVAELALAAPGAALEQRRVLALDEELAPGARQAVDDRERPHLLEAGRADQ